MVSLFLKHLVAELCIESMFSSIQQNFAQLGPTRLDQLISDLQTYEYIHISPDEHKMLKEAMVLFDIMFFEGDKAVINECV